MRHIFQAKAMLFAILLGVLVIFSGCYTQLASPTPEYGQRDRTYRTHEEKGRDKEYSEDEYEEYSEDEYAEEDYDEE